MWVTECAASSRIPLAIHVSFSGWLVAWLHRAYHPAKQQSHSSTFYRIPRFGCFAGARVNLHLISSFYMKCHQKWQGWDRERGRDTKDYQAILSRCFILRIPMTIGRQILYYSICILIPIHMYNILIIFPWIFPNDLVITIQGSYCRAPRALARPWLIIPVWNSHNILGKSPNFR